MDKQQVVMIIMLVLVAATTLSEMYKYYLKQQKRKQVSDNTDEVLRLKQHNEQLEQRVRVLERIVTDNDYQLKQEFETLSRNA
ncbi:MULTISPECIES: hypothetical protein [Shewanella]|uniref:Phage shock protein B n=1 Tax=Shewanella marisflavi TaxID=260364 RepID=A0AAC9U3M2_9GAMM|nr:hypothetical protein [Shewanella marisflavi]ASJ98462.1 hypothetical protein CFF01_18740 [Shewanella marisflavi]MCL1043584.1 hypothetical protein [Shewanella marisflavi]